MPSHWRSSMVARSNSATEPRRPSICLPLEHYRDTLLKKDKQPDPDLLAGIARCTREAHASQHQADLLRVAHDTCMAWLNGLPDDAVLHVSGPLRLPQVGEVLAAPEILLGLTVDWSSVRVA